MLHTITYYPTTYIQWGFEES